MTTECDQGTNEIVVVVCLRGARPSSTTNYLRNSNGQVKYFKQDTWFLSVVFGFCVSRVVVVVVVCVHGYFGENGMDHVKLNQTVN